MLVEQVLVCWWAVFWWYFRKKNFVLKATIIRIFVCGCKHLGRHAGWKCRPPDLRHCPKP